MTGTRAYKIIRQAATLTGNERAQALLEQDKDGAWLRMVMQLGTGEGARYAASTGISEEAFDADLAKLLSWLALASVDQRVTHRITLQLLAESTATKTRGPRWETQA